MFSVCRMRGKNRDCAGLLNVLALLLILSPTLAMSEVWEFQSVNAAIPPQSDFFSNYNQRLYSFSTAINNHGTQFGVYTLPNDITKSYSITFSDNPEFSVIDSENFISLTAGAPTCIFGFCSEWPFGIRLTETEAFTSWLDSPSDTTPTPGSLPFSRFPGNFVSENETGVIASTQISSESQFSVIVPESRESVIELPDIAWVVALSSGTEPLVLGYRGDNGHCLVYGHGCEPPECDEADDGGHENTRGKGHREHGRGHGYGHDHDDCHEEDRTTHGVSTSTADESTGSVLIKAHSDGTTERWGFPEYLDRKYDYAKVEKTFPLAMNDNQVILRATIKKHNQVWPNRLLQCRLGPEIDTDGDGIVNCEGGLMPVIPPAEAQSVDTVLGFNLNADGKLIGNYGFNAAGIGNPFFLDTTAEAPTMHPLRNRVKKQEGWELNTITDINQQGTAVGYGYSNCSSKPDAYTLYPVSDTTLPQLAIQHQVQSNNGAVLPGEKIRPKMDLSGGSGNYLYRLDSKRPEDAEWHAEHGWREELGSYQSSQNHEGDVCLRVRVQDSANANRSTQTMIRIRVTETLRSGAREQDLIGDRDTGSAMDMLHIGSTGQFALLALALAGVFRRRMT